jgi:hypothetical protein
MAVGLFLLFNIWSSVNDDTLTYVHVRVMKPTWCTICLQFIQSGQPTVD